MARKQTLIVFPHLNDCKGDLTKDWYVEWSFRIPGEEKPIRQRAYSELRLPTAEERIAAAEKVIKEKTEWIKSGKYLNGRPDRVYVDELLYRQEAKLYGQARTGIATLRSNLSSYLVEIRQQVNNKTYQNYQSKLRAFAAFLEKNRLDHLSLKNITRTHIIHFSTQLSESGLSRLTIKKYIQIIHSYFDYELLKGNVEYNPAEKIPPAGKIIDMAAVPFHTDERKRLREAIESEDPQLWLACEIQYYCAIRPGTELRLMRIDWIDFARKKIKVPVAEAKSNRVDIVDIPAFLFEKIKYLESYNKHLYVFGKFGRPGTVCLGKNTMRNRFNRYREALNISPDRKYYSWKHTGAIQLLDNGLQPIDLQGHLRHRSFATTEVYIKKRAGNLTGKVDRFSSEI